MLSVLASSPSLGALGAAEIGEAAGASLVIAACASGLAVSFGLLLASAAASAPDGRQSTTRARGIDLIVLALVGLPPFALVAGLFVLLKARPACRRWGWCSCRSSMR